MIRTKSFTLIEILIASTIFVMVTVTSMASFAMVKNSNYRSDDLRTAQGCAREARDIVSAFARSASPKTNRISGIKLNTDGLYTLVTLTEAKANFAGFAVFTDENNFNILYKIQLDDGSFSYKTSSTAVAINATGKYGLSSTDKPIFSSDCSAFTSGTSGYFSDYQFERPFEIHFQKHSPDYDESKQSDKIAVVSLKDVIFRSRDKAGGVLNQAYSLEKKSFASVDMSITSSARSLW